MVGPIDARSASTILTIALTVSSWQSRAAEDASGLTTLWSSSGQADLDVHHEVHLRGSINELQLLSTRVLTLERDQSNAVAVQSAVEYGNAMRLAVEGDLWDLGRVSGKASEGIVRANSAQWQVNRVANGKVDLGLLDDRVRFTAQTGWSDYEASEPYLRIAAKNEKRERDRAARFVEGEGTGNAWLGRWENDIVRTDSLGLTLFGETSSVDATYEDLRFSDKRRSKSEREHPFAEPNRDSSTIGLAFAWGPIGTTLGHRWSARSTDDAGRDHRERAVQVGGDIDLGFLKSSSARGITPRINWMVPDSVWAKWSGGPVENADGSDVAVGRKSDWSVGSSWSFEGGYASVSGWWSRSEDPRSDLAGAGADLSVGVYNDRGGVDAYLSLSESREADPDNRSSELILGGGVSYWLTYEDLPAISGSLQVDGYQGAYPVWLGQEEAHSLSGSLGLDLSSYLDPAAGAGTLRIVYAFHRDSYSSRWSDWRSSHSGIDHFIGIAVRTKL